MKLQLLFLVAALAVLASALFEEEERGYYSGGNSNNNNNGGDGSQPSGGDGSQPSGGDGSSYPAAPTVSPSKTVAFADGNWNCVTGMSRSNSNSFGEFTNFKII